MVKYLVLIAFVTLLIFGFQIRILALFSLFFICLIIRECLPNQKIKMNSNFRQSYLGLLTLLAIAFGWSPFTYWNLERKLTQVASELAGKSADVHCNSILDELVDSHFFYAGHANFSTGEIVIQPRWCSEIKKYIKAPTTATLNGIYTLNLLTHEAMHIRGERIEEKTECQAVQRNYQTAKLLGVPAPHAQKHAETYYREIYPKNNREYYSIKCAPGKALDEQLPNAPWARAAPLKFH